ncbi:hypothetical protein [Cryptosporangium arvum]|uniref:Uncharacterized protein n=1 Tax=Cryptosporangium arvum DSM 44712 TaxID=927661 RepID=A0A010ZS52_9ACTN|nr:hypothetical protein [Cryptosporangium arvum]EXG81499.1 hypothetical protein CryarDRAFT_2614 [Cryptosporangium arvum DSM 44712]
MSDTVSHHPAAEAPAVDEDAGGLAFVGESMGEEPPPRRRRRWLVLLLVAALAVPGVVCVGFAASFSSVVHRDPPPDLESPAVIGAHEDTVRLVTAALTTATPAGTTPVTTARYDACVRGSRQLKAWDDFDWVCATRGAAVLSLPAADLRATLSAERSRLAAAGWTVVADRLDARFASAEERAWNVVELDRDGVRLALSYGPADRAFAGDCVLLQKVDVSAWATPNWEVGSPALDGAALDAALRPGVALVLVTAQRVWFAN